MLVCILGQSGCAQYTHSSFYSEVFAHGEVLEKHNQSKATIIFWLFRDNHKYGLLTITEWADTSNEFHYSIKSVTKIVRHTSLFTSL